jgi:hypothetical protein
VSLLLLWQQSTGFDPAGGIPHNADDGERFVGSQCCPDPTTDLYIAFLPPVLRAWALDGDEIQAQPTADDTAQPWAVAPPAATPFDPATGFPWTIADGERYVVSGDVAEPDSAVAFGFTLYDPAAGFPWNQDQGERFVASQMVADDTPSGPGLAPPAAPAVTALSAWAVDGGEVQAVPVDDSTIQSWAVRPPLNATQALAFNQPDEAAYVTVEDPTVPALAVTPPPYIPVFASTAFTGDPENWPQAPGEDPSVQAWAVQPPLNAVAAQAFNQPDEAAFAPVLDDTSQAYSIQPVAAGFDPATVVWTGRDDIVQPVWSIPDDTSQAWAIGPLPMLRAFNEPQEPVIPAWVIDHQAMTSWAATLGAVIGTGSVGFIPGGIVPAFRAAGRVINPTAGGHAALPVPTGTVESPAPDGTVED